MRRVVVGTTEEPTGIGNFTFGRACNFLEHRVYHIALDVHSTTFTYYTYIHIAIIIIYIILY
jgi:hypothetical protein